MQTLLNLQFMLEQICGFIQKKIHETLLVKVSWIVFVAHVLKVESGLTQLSMVFQGMQMELKQTKTEKTFPSAWQPLFLSIF